MKLVVAVTNGGVANSVAVEGTAGKVVGTGALLGAGIVARDVGLI